MSARRCQCQFAQEARRAIQAGTLTARETAILARAGTRKACYWCAHLARLRELLRERAR